MSTPVSLGCRDIVVQRAHACVLDGVSFGVRAGELVSLLGVNGAGKSTLLRVLLGLLAPTAGEVELHGQPLQRHARRTIAQHVAWVPQHHTPQFPYTVEQIVMLGRLPHRGLMRAPRRQDREIVAAAIDDMQIAHLAQRDYGALSGGERQRVMLARALAQGARILLLDEPFAGLDYGQHLRLLERLAALAASGYAIVNTNHRPDDACNLSTRVALLDGGRIVADGPPREVLDAQTVSALYRAPVEQLDIDGQRFFRARTASTVIPASPLPPSNTR
ncbi:MULTISPECIES: ABC transporter ATP-binding protein [unclassified Paraburkholderia]|uniref:ABC transporter ATP-binding protein n=1 Tax=unclassified Paraburkholderia TaxID=2615204 RepID=UPI002AAF104E|nr:MULTISPECIES: ABC transporter ATP-binding protein [unclassified Paraburkholderia]